MKIKRRKELNINFYCSKLKIKMIPLNISRP